MRHSVICMMNGANPRVRIGTMTRLKRMLDGLNRMALRPETRNRMIHTDEINWAITFATAAPFTPQPSTKMNTGSRMMLVPVPISTEVIATVVLPCAEMKLLSPSVSCTNTVPTR